MATPEKTIIEGMFVIPNKQGVAVPFLLNSAQTTLDNRLGMRNLVPKARQEGVSAYILARYTVACLTKPNTRAVVISHDKESTQRMLMRVHGYLASIRGPKPVLQLASKNELTFPKTNSMFYIGTAGARKFGRGDTITHFHGSEVAYWNDPKEMVGGALQAVPVGTGEVTLESTGNGAGTWFHRTVMRAKSSPDSIYNLVFLDWLTFPEYDLRITDQQKAEIMGNLQEEFQERELVEKFKLTAGQLHFRRMKLEEMDYDLGLFKQEYPMTLDECFQTSGASYFHKVNYVPDIKWHKDEKNFWLLHDHPKISDHYRLGVDVAAGVGRDNSVIEIFSENDAEQVGEFISDKIGPDVFAAKVAELGRRFNNGYICVESNNHGAVTLDNLRSLYPVRLLHKDKLQNNRLVDLGYRTTSRSKPLLVGNLRKKLAHGLIIHSEFLKNELSTFVETDEGRLEAQQGCFDDTVIAAALAVMDFPRAEFAKRWSKGITKKVPYGPFSFETLIADLKAKRALYPTEDQTDYM